MAAVNSIVSPHLRRYIPTELSPFYVGNGTGKEKEKASAIPTYPVTLLWHPRMKKQALRATAGMPGPKSHSFQATPPRSSFPTTT